MRAACIYKEALSLSGNDDGQKRALHGDGITAQTGFAYIFYFRGVINLFYEMLDKKSQLCGLMTFDDMRGCFFFFFFFFLCRLDFIPFHF